MSLNLYLNSFFIEHLLHVRDCSRHFEGSSEQNGQRQLLALSLLSRMHIDTSFNSHLKGWGEMQRTK